MLWKILVAMERHKKEWDRETPGDLDLDQIEDIVKKNIKQFYFLERNLPSSSALQAAKEDSNNYCRIIPVAKTLLNEYLKPEHRTEIINI
jgi:hypothetical protein